MENYRTRAIEKIATVTGFVPSYTQQDNKIQSNAAHALNRTLSDSKNYGKTLLDNTASAVMAGQAPIPYFTKQLWQYDNSKFDVPDGKPAYFGMRGAGFEFSNYDMLGFNGRKTEDGPISAKNTRMYPWFDRQQALKDMVEFHRTHPNSPIDMFGESYGGNSAIGVANMFGEKGGKIRNLVAYDPVGRAGLSAPTNMTGRAINIQPQYAHPLDWHNMIATIGGRHPEMSGATTVKYYGDDGSPEKSTANHAISHDATIDWLTRLGELQTTLAR